jgi:AcrR family transcriptional regulator
LGLRETAKLSKRRRIEGAARVFFARKGFRGATVREIATRARVASGTIFLYAQDKQELLLMIVNDDLDKLTDARLPRTNGRADLVDRLIAFYRPRYEYWARNPEMSRDAMAEMAASHSRLEARPESARGEARRAKMATRLRQILSESKQTHRTERDADRDAVAKIVMSIYFTEVRLWLNDAIPNPETGLERLRRLFRVAVT